MNLTERSFSFSSVEAMKRASLLLLAVVVCLMYSCDVTSAQVPVDPTVTPVAPVSDAAVAPVSVAAVAPVSDAAVAPVSVVAVAPVSVVAVAPVSVDAVAPVSGTAPLFGAPAAVASSSAPPDLPKTTTLPRVNLSAQDPLFFQYPQMLAFLNAEGVPEFKTLYTLLDFPRSKHLGPGSYALDIVSGSRLNITLLAPVEAAWQQFPYSIDCLESINGYNFTDTILRSHILTGVHNASELGQMPGAYPSVGGSTITAARLPTGVTVNDANIVMPDRQMTYQGWVHGIDKVILPPGFAEAWASVCPQVAVPPPPTVAAPIEVPAVASVPTAPVTDANGVVLTSDPAAVASGVAVAPTIGSTTGVAGPIATTDPAAPIVAAPVASTAGVSAVTQSPVNVNDPSHTTGGSGDANNLVGEEKPKSSVATQNHLCGFGFQLFSLLAAMVASIAFSAAA